MCVCDLSVRECECVFIACRASECECALLLCFVVCVYWHTCLTATPLCVFLLAFALLLHTCLTAGPLQKRKKKGGGGEKEKSRVEGKEESEPAKRDARCRHSTERRSRCAACEPPAATRSQRPRPKSGKSHAPQKQAPATTAPPARPPAAGNDAATPGPAPQVRAVSCAAGAGSGRGGRGREGRVVWVRSGRGRESVVEGVVKAAATALPQMRFSARKAWPQHRHRRADL